MFLAFVFEARFITCTFSIVCMTHDQKFKLKEKEQNVANEKQEADKCDGTAPFKARIQKKGKNN